MAGYKSLAEDRKQRAVLTYRAVEDMLALLVSLLDMTLEGAGVKWLQQLEATQELR